MPLPRRVELPFIGPSSKTRVTAQQSGRSVNLYPEVNDPDAKAPIALKHVPGSFRWADGEALLGLTGPVRGCHVMGRRAFCAIGFRLLEITPSNQFLTIGSLPSSQGYVGFSDNRGKLIVGDGIQFQIYDPDTGVLAPVFTENGDALRGYHSRLLDSTTLYFIKDSDRYYYSDVGAPQTVQDLSFFEEEGSSDTTVNAFVSNREIILLGTDSTGWHYNSGDADNPFQRIEGGFAEYGCVGMRACCTFDNTVAMVGRNRDGAGKVYLIGNAGAAPQVISSPAVEEALQKVLFSFEDITDQITMFGYQDAGHVFLFVNLPAAIGTNNNPAQPSMTWVYDAATRLWHERAYSNPATGQMERARGDQHFYWNRRHYLTDYALPYVYEHSLDYYRENTTALVKLRQSAGPFNFQGRPFTVVKLGIEMEVGVGRDAGVQGSRPKLMLQVSWDAGSTWSNEIWRDIGGIGAGKTVVQFGNLGRGTDLVIRASVSDPVRVTFLGAWADVK